VAQAGGRVGTGGFVGNDGHLALLLALAAVASIAVVLSAKQPLLRVAAGTGILLYLGGLAVKQSLTGVVVLIAGALLLVAMRLDRRAVIGTALVIAVLGGSFMAYPALSARAREVLGAVRAGEWDRLLSYRLGPWAAAVEMARARPILGWGPGTFGAEFVPHRLEAELRFRRRFVNPFLAGAYTEAHSDYLQALAELGIPATLAALGAATALVVGVTRAARSGSDASSRHEAMFLLAILLAAGAAALTWFPAQRPITAIPLLLAAGRAWRVSGPRVIEDAP
jgi:O-antigen ligase